MNEEKILISLGFPADEAICICHSMRREGTLAAFIEQEQKKQRCRRCTAESCDECVYIV